MRRGQVFRRCRCGARVPERRCPKCGSESFSWTFVVDVAPEGGQRRQIKRGGFATKAEALEKMSELQKEKADGTFVEPSKLTLNAYLRSWLAGVKADVRGSTWVSYETAMRLHVGPRLGEVPLQQLTRNQVKGIYAELRESGRSPKTVHNTHLALRKALADAVDSGLLRANPAERAHKLPTDRPEMEAWSAEELRAFLARSDGDPNLSLWHLAAYSGMRRGELLGLRWQDVDLDAGQLSVRQQLVRQGEAITFGPPKTKAGRRSISLDGDTVATLRERRARWSADKLHFGEAFGNLDLVFCRPDGKPHDPDVITQQFESACRRAGVKRIRFHDLRHTHATLLLVANVNPKIVMQRLGHSSIVVTMDRYSHVLPGLDQDAAARMAALVSGGL